MLDFDSLAHQLAEWAAYHRVEERSIADFWHCVRGYQVANREECLRHFGENPLDEGQFTVAVSDLSVTCNTWPPRGQGYITVYIPIIYKGRNMGLYRSIYTPNGEDEDDYFHIDPMP